jgi:Flp pilus assembly pilin Flp
VLIISLIAVAMIGALAVFFPPSVAATFTDAAAQL